MKPIFRSLWFLLLISLLAVGGVWKLLQPVPLWTRTLQANESFAGWYDTGGRLVISDDNKAQVLRTSDGSLEKSFDFLDAKAVDKRDETLISLRNRNLCQLRTQRNGVVQARAFNDSCQGNWKSVSIPGDVMRLIDHSNQLLLINLVPGGTWDVYSLLQEKKLGTLPIKLEDLQNQVLAISNSGKYLALYEEAEQGAKVWDTVHHIGIWDVGAGKRLGNIAGKSIEVTELYFTPDEKYLVANSKANTAWLGEIESLNLLDHKIMVEGSSETSFRGADSNRVVTMEVDTADKEFQNIYRLQGDRFEEKIGVYPKQWGTESYHFRFIPARDHLLLWKKVPHFLPDFLLRMFGSIGWKSYPYRTHFMLGDFKGNTLWRQTIEGDELTQPVLSEDGKWLALIQTRDSAKTLQIWSLDKLHSKAGMVPWIVGILLAIQLLSLGLQEPSKAEQVTASSRA